MRVAHERTEIAKDERLDVRLSHEQKEQIERAAALSGLSVTSLVVRGALREAADAIRDHEVLRLSDRDSRTFVQALVAPPPLSPRMLDAIERYNTEFGSQSS